MSQSNEKPTTLFVHGAWHNSTCWDPIRFSLSKLSHPTHAVRLPSSGNAVNSHLEDTAVIRNALGSLILSEGKAVVLVMYSDGGVAGTNAVSGLEMTTRKENGEKGGIIHCLFIAAFLVPKGMSLIGMFPEPPPYLAPDPEDPNYLIVKNPKEIFYNDVSPSAAEPWIAQMKHQSTASFMSAVDSVAWESGLVLCTYLICEQDNGVFLWLQEQMLEGVRKESGRPWTVKKCDCSHSAWLSQVSTVVRLVRKGTGGDVD